MIPTLVGEDGTFVDSSFVVASEDYGAYFTAIASAGSGTTTTMFADSAATDCFRTVASGNWNSTSTWESAPSPCTVWTAATLTPTSAANTITIRSGHTVHITAAVTVDQVTVDSGGTLIVDSGVIQTIANGTGTDLQVNGSMTVNGTLNGFAAGGSFAASSGATSRSLPEEP